MSDVSTQLLGESFERLRAACGHDDASTPGDELSGTSLAYAAARARDQHRLVIESIHADAFLASSICSAKISKACRTLSPDFALTGTNRQLSSLAVSI
jgi:hypothetical protein